MPLAFTQEDFLVFYCFKFCLRTVVPIYFQDHWRYSHKFLNCAYIRENTVACTPFPLWYQFAFKMSSICISCVRNLVSADFSFYEYDFVPTFLEAPQAFPGAPAGGARGEADREAEDDGGGAKESALVQKVSKVRTEFPESWIWTEVVSRYTFCNAQKLANYWGCL